MAPTPASSPVHRRPSRYRLLPVDPDLDLAPDDPAGSTQHVAHRHLQRPPHRRFDVLVAIAVGGFLGSWGRYQLGLVWPTPAGRLPWVTLIINTSGSFVLGLVLPLILTRRLRSRYLRPFLCVGVLGAWTTMSTLSLEEDLLLRGDRLATAGGYLVLTVVLGLVAAWCGMALAAHLDTRRRRRWASP